MKLHEVVDMLIEKAVTLGALVGSPHGFAYERALEDDQPIPDHLLPGRAIMSLPGRVRRRLHKLRSEHFQHWIK